MADKPRAVPRVPQRLRAVDESKVQQLERQLEAEESGVSPGFSPGISPPTGLADLRAREPASSQARAGTVAAPYRRKDGSQTRSTTFHLPVETVRRIKQAAAERECKMSAIVTEALEQWLDERARG